MKIVKIALRVVPLNLVLGFAVLYGFVPCLAYRGPPFFVETFHPGLEEYCLVV